MTDATMALCALLQKSSDTDSLRQMFKGYVHRGIFR
jgi:hypothetical protein